MTEHCGKSVTSPVLGKGSTDSSPRTTGERQKPMSIRFLHQKPKPGKTDAFSQFTSVGSWWNDNKRPRSKKGLTRRTGRSPRGGRNEPRPRQNHSTHPKHSRSSPNPTIELYGLSERVFFYLTDDLPLHRGLRRAIVHHRARPLNPKDNAVIGAPSSSSSRPARSSSTRGQG